MSTTVPQTGSGAARRRREQAKRALGRHVVWLSQVTQARSAHHSHPAGSDLQGLVAAMRLEILDLRRQVAELHQAKVYEATQPPCPATSVQVVSADVNMSAEEAKSAEKGDVDLVEDSTLESGPGLLYDITQEQATALTKTAEAASALSLAARAAAGLASMQEQIDACSNLSKVANNLAVYTYYKIGLAQKRFGPLR